MFANPWVILFALVAFGAIVGGVAWKAYGMGKDAVYAEQARAEQATREALEKVVQESAGKIVKIHEQNRVTTQRVQREIQEHRYYVDCKSSDGVLNDFNALVGSSNTARSDQLPKADTDQ